MEFVRLTAAQTISTPLASRTLSPRSIELPTCDEPTGRHHWHHSMTYTGDPALRWRQRSLEGDSASLEREIRTSVESFVPVWPRTQGLLHRQARTTTSSRSSSTSRSKEISAPPPANACCFQRTSSRPIPSPLSPTRNAIFRSTFSTPTSIRTPFASSFRHFQNRVSPNQRLRPASRSLPLYTCIRSRPRTASPSAATTF